MKIFIFLCTAALVVSTGCSKSGMIDTTGPATTASKGPATHGNVPGKSATPQRIAHGQEVDILAYVVPGKTTIFDFTSEGCPPCRQIAPYLHKLHAERADIVVVEVDLNRPGVGNIDWASPVARQYNLGSIPAFKIFGPDGHLQAEGDTASQIVRSMLR